MQTKERLIPAEDAGRLGLTPSPELDAVWFTRHLSLTSYVASVRPCTFQYSVTQDQGSRLGTCWDINMNLGSLPVLMATKCGCFYNESLSPMSQL